MKFLVAASTSGTDWGTLLGGIGIGAIVGAALTGLVTFINGARQRSHDREMRELDHKHDTEAREADHRRELAVKQLEDKQRLRDMRLNALRDGLPQVVLGMTVVQAVFLEMLFHRADSEMVHNALREAETHLALARPQLLLDPGGREVLGKFNTAVTFLTAWADMSDERGRELLEKVVLEHLADAVQTTSQLMEKAAQPVTS